MRMCENCVAEGGHAMIFDNIMFHNVEELEEIDKGRFCNAASYG